MVGMSTNERNGSDISAFVAVRSVVKVEVKGDVVAA